MTPYSLATHCSWLVMEVTNHFLRNGSNPILTLLDCTKAFDTCKFDVLFQKLLDRKLPPLVVRTLAVVYQEQYAWVRCGSSRSDMFSILNGTRQGSVLSPALFSVYMDNLLLELRALVWAAMLVECTWEQWDLLMTFCSLHLADVQ